MSWGGVDADRVSLKRQEHLESAEPQASAKDAVRIQSSHPEFGSGSR